MSAWRLPSPYLCPVDSFPSGHRRRFDKDNRGIQLRGDDWHIKGITVTKAGDTGSVEGKESDCNGFKLGGDDVRAQHILKNLYATGNATGSNGSSGRSFTNNSNPASLSCSGCASWGNLIHAWMNMLWASARGFKCSTLEPEVPLAINQKRGSWRVYRLGVFPPRRSQRR